jgi:hypothetical protein
MNKPSSLSFYVSDDNKMASRLSHLAFFDVFVDIFDVRDVFSDTTSSVLNDAASGKVDLAGSVILDGSVFGFNLVVNLNNGLEFFQTWDPLTTESYRLGASISQLW